MFLPALSLLLVAAAAPSARGEPCSAEQLACISAAQAEVDAIVATPLTTGDVCLAHSDAFNTLAACVGPEGCDGADLTAAKDACFDSSDLSDAFCSVDCSGIAMSLNAQTYDEPAAAHAFTTDGNASQPALTFNGRQASVPLQSQASNESEPGVGFDVLWQSSAGSSALANVPPAATASGRVIAVSADGTVLALGGDGEAHWEFSPEGDVVAAPVTGAQGDVIVGDTLGFLYRLDEHTGQEVQRWQLGGPVVSSALLAQDYVFAVARGAVGGASTLHKLPLSSAENSTEPRMTWRRPLCTHDPLRLDWVGTALSLTGDGAVLVACRWQGYVDAYEASSGALRWSAESPATDANNTFDAATPLVFGAPVADAAGNVYATYPRGGLLKLDAQGQTVFSQDNFFLSRVPGVMALDEGAQQGFALDSEGILYVFALSDGALVRSVSELPASASQGLSPALDADGRVILAGGDTLLVLGPGGETVLSRVSLGSRAATAPALVQGAAVVGTERSVAVAVGAAPIVTPPPPPAPPTAPPTRGPTVTGEVQNGDDHDHGWPPAAIGVVSVLAIIDAALLLVVVGRALRDRDGDDDDAKRGFEGSGSGSGDFEGSPRAETPASPGMSKPAPNALSKQ